MSRSRASPSAHNEGDPVQHGIGTNYIFVVLMDGFRIAHFGDIGQAALTEERLAALGKLDLAVMQFDNSSIAAEREGSVWRCCYTEKLSIEPRREILTNETRLIFMGALARGYAEYSGATRVDW